MSLFERRDVIIVASVSCIYGLGDPEDYSELVVSLRLGQKKPQEEILHKLVDIQYSRNDMTSNAGPSASTAIQSKSFRRPSITPSSASKCSAMKSTGSRKSTS